MIEVRNVKVDGEVYTPLFCDNKMIEIDDLEVLANTERASPVRRLRCVLATEERPRSEQPGFDLANGKFDVPPGCPLVLGETRFVIGRIEGPTHIVDGRLIGTVRLLQTKLAEIVWRAIRDGTLTGLCIVIKKPVDDPVTGRCRGGRFVAVQLGHSSTSCLPSAQIIDSWESESDA